MRSLWISAVLMKTIPERGHYSRNVALVRTSPKPPLLYSHTTMRGTGPFNQYPADFDIVLMCPLAVSEMELRKQSFNAELAKIQAVKSSQLKRAFKKQRQKSNFRFGAAKRRANAWEKMTRTQCPTDDLIIQSELSKITDRHSGDFHFGLDMLIKLGTMIPDMEDGIANIMAGIRSH